MTNAQLEKSRRIRAKQDYENTYFIESHIEELPFISNTIDAVISNGVINLSSNKMKVFLEVARILKPGGTFAFADIVSTRKMPESITMNSTLWAACIGGAMQVNEYFNYLEHAGFSVEEVKENPYDFISNSAKGATKNYGIRSLSIKAKKK
jgi:ubiquinone/menaquinone biosynthesis C-methylase UbiE